MPKEQSITFSIRIPLSLRAELEASAAVADRSLNAEVIARMRMACSPIGPQSCEVRALQLRVEALERWRREFSGGNA